MKSTLAKRRGPQSTTLLREHRSPAVRTGYERGVRHHLEDGSTLLLERGSRKRRHLVKAREDYGDSVLQQRLIETCVLVDGEEALRITLWVVVGTLSWVRIVEFETPDIVRRLLPQ